MISPSLIYAKSVSMPSVDIDCTIKKDGIIEMTEKRVIQFDGDFTFGYYDLPKSDYDKIKEFQISDEKITYTLDKTMSKNPGTYYWEGNRIYYYFSVSNETKTFTVQYTIHNAVSIYEDYGEFYWQIQPDGWDFSVKSYKAVVKWESAIIMEDYRIWAHGPLWGSFTKTDEYSSNLIVEDLPGKTYVDVRVLLPTNYFNVSPNKQGKILETAVEEETRLANEANARRNEAKKLIKTGNIIQWFLYLLAIFFIGLLLFLYNKFGTEFQIANEAIYYREPPSNLRPALVGMLYNFQKYADTFLQATILDLIRRKWIQYEEVEGNFFTRDYKMTKLENSNDTLNNYETTLMDDILFDDKSTTTIKELKKKFNLKQNHYYYKFQNYVNQVKAGIKEKNYFDFKSNNISVLVIVLGILMIILNFIFGISLSVFFFGNPKIGFLILVPVGILYCFSYNALKRRTQKGKEEFVKWKAFRSFMKDFSNLKEYGPKSLIIWEKFLVYATVFGIASVVLKALKVVAPNLTDQNGGTFLGPAYFVAGTTPSFSGLQRSLSSIGTAVNNIPKTAASSSSSGSGGGGGFSGGGGSSGGGGGGGGGGFG